MPNSNAAEIISDFLVALENWLAAEEAEPDLDLPPLPPPRPQG